MAALRGRPWLTGGNSVLSHEPDAVGNLRADAGDVLGAFREAGENLCLRDAAIEAAVPIGDAAGLAVTSSTL